MYPPLNRAAETPGAAEIHFSRPDGVSFKRPPAHTTAASRRLRPTHEGPAPPATTPTNKKKGPCVPKSEILELIRHARQEFVRRALELPINRAAPAS